MFEIDHLRPVSGSPVLALEYKNLIYSCSVCNLAKGAETIPDPSRVFTTATVCVQPDGTLVPRTPLAKRLIRQLDLNDPEFVRWRHQMIRIVQLAERHDPDLYLSLLAYPEDLPDLSVLKPPGGNTRPTGVTESYFSRRSDGTLPDRY